MENLVKDMQNMFNIIKKDNENYFLCSSRYDPKVKVSEWYLPLEAEPKDRDPYNPPGGNYFLSTYKRFGTHNNGVMESETHAMLQQICDVRQHLTLHKPLVNFSSNRLISQEEDTKHGHEEWEEANFTTTYNYDYRLPFPFQKVHKLYKEENAQKRFGLSSKYSPSKICETKFLDDEYYDNLKSNSVKPYKLDPPYQIDNICIC